jgi:hypothetical protein
MKRTASNTWEGKQLGAMVNLSILLISPERFGCFVTSDQLIPDIGLIGRYPVSSLHTFTTDFLTSWTSGSFLAMLRDAAASSVPCRSRLSMGTKGVLIEDRIMPTLYKRKIFVSEAAWADLMNAAATAIQLDPMTVSIGRSAKRNKAKNKAETFTGNLFCHVTHTASAMCTSL